MSSEKLIENLEVVMRREVAILRELLSSLHQEQQALIHGQAAAVREVHKSREALVEAMSEARSERLDLIARLGEITAEHCEIVSLRAHLIELLDAVRLQTTRNNGLLENKVQMTHQIIHQLQPKDPNKTYGSKGLVKPSVKTATLTLINREV